MTFGGAYLFLRGGCMRGTAYLGNSTCSYFPTVCVLPGRVEDRWKPGSLFGTP